MEAARKRGRPGGDLAGSKSRKDAESDHPGSKKACTKFFSTTGCPFGEACHFLHYVPGGVKAVAHMLNFRNPTIAPLSRNHMVPPGIHDGPSVSAVKTRMCSKYNTGEGCKFGDKCHFAHGEWELGRSAHDDPLAPSMAGKLGRGHFEQPQPAGLGAAASFGATAKAKISIDASLAGAIIGKGGSNTKHIVRVTGARLSICDHESDPKLKNIELEGTFDQIKEAGSMVRELIVNIDDSTAAFPASKSAAAAPRGPGSNYKTKLCEKFAKGSCTFGDRCCFSHGESELHNAAA